MASWQRWSRNFKEPAKSRSCSRQMWLALPPEKPVQPKVVMPRRFAHSMARSTLGLFPEPLMATSRSPGPARFFSCSTNMRSKPSSLPQAKMYGVLSVKLMMRNRFLRSLSRCSLAPPSELANCSTGKTQTQSTPWAPLILRLETSSGRSTTRSKPCNTRVAFRFSFRLMPTSAHDHSQVADRHSKISHQHSQK